LTNAGPLTVELEARLKKRLDVAFCAAFCNGTTALLTALRALAIDGEVITTPFTFPATPHCIEWNRLRPVFCDIDPETYNIDPAAVEAVIGPETSAILPVHVFGNPCDTDALQEIADRHGLSLLYDAAHAFGVTYRGTPIGRFGDLSALSFHATKVFHTAEGGAVVSGNDSLREQLALLRNFGIVDENRVQGVGLNGKLSELHAALGLLVLGEIDSEIERRGALSALYRGRLGEVPGIRFQRFAEGTGRNFFNFSIEIDPDEFGLSRDQVHKGLTPEGIVSRKYFHPLCSENECYRGLPSAAIEGLANANRVSHRILSLPLHGGLDEAHVDGVCDALIGLRNHADAARRALEGSL
jgi:dTDP-4-amino-4,6-dideoxygalactose transaminase